MPLAVAGMAEEKVRKYSCLALPQPTHTIMPVAVETLCAVGPHSLAFLKEPAARMNQLAVWGGEGIPVLVAAAVGCGAKGKFCGSRGGTVGGPPAADIFV